MGTRLHVWLRVIVLICMCELFIAPGRAAAPPQGIDALTAPIALYPDALWWHKCWTPRRTPPKCRTSAPGSKELEPEGQRASGSRIESRL